MVCLIKKAGNRLKHLLIWKHNNFNAYFLEALKSLGPYFILERLTVFGHQHCLNWVTEVNPKVLVIASCADLIIPQLDSPTNIIAPLASIGEFKCFGCNHFPQSTAYRTCPICHQTFCFDCVWNWQWANWCTILQRCCCTLCGLLENRSSARCCLAINAGKSVVVNKYACVTHCGRCFNNLARCVLVDS